ncbi:hypothetical protein MBESOW_P1301 [Sphingobium xenophagum]|jgi:hypothetical protein|uniref:Uncharacterized protein n=2 Tax=Sphingomonadaceae TaxID=41297 RepID=A0A401J091_SPHXE|nr:hypothetical protein MBESOW_P1301 [Sphingobium xenophagum]
MDMGTARATLTTKLQASPAARVRFMNSLLGLLKDQGVDIDDAAAIKDLGLHLDLTDGKAWFDGSVASTNIITINH